MSGWKTQKQSVSHNKNSFLPLFSSLGINSVYTKISISSAFERLVPEYTNPKRHNQRRTFHHLLSYHLGGSGEETWASEAGRTACGHTLLLIHLAGQNMLSGINLQNPLTHCDSLSSLVFPPAATITHSARLKSVPSAVKYRHNAALFPPRHRRVWLWDGKVLKASDLFGKENTPQPAMLHVLRALRYQGSGSGSEERGAGWDLGHSQGFLMGSGCSVSHDAKISNQPPLNWTDGNKQASPTSQSRI